MSWAAVGPLIKDVLKSPWMKNQAPHVLVLFVLLGVVTAYVFVVQPRERIENREAWKALRADIQGGYERQEGKHTEQIVAIHTDRKEERQELMRLILREKVNGAADVIRNISEQIAATVGENDRAERDDE